MSQIIGITMGDPAGVGPEISIKALVEMDADARARTRIYGNRATLEAARAEAETCIELDPPGQIEGMVQDFIDRLDSSTPPESTER